MKQFFRLLLILLGISTSTCEAPKSTSDTDIYPKADSLPFSDSIVTEVPSFPTPPQLAPCAFDSVEFQRQYGQGLVLLKYNGFPFTVYAKPDTNSPSQLLTRSEVYYRDVVVSGQPDGYFQWYQSPNEMEDGLIIRTNDPGPTQPVRIRLNDQDKDWWLIPDTTLLPQHQNHVLISWENYIGGQTFFISSGNSEDNPLRTAPNDTAKAVPYPEKHRLYSVTDVQMPWIQVNHLIEKNGVYGNDKWSEPIGWMKWICNGEERIDGLDPFELEGYYAEKE